MKPSDSGCNCQELKAQIAQQQKIIESLMKRVERGMDMQGDAYAMFQSATVLEEQVRQRTLAYEAAVQELRQSNTQLNSAKEAAEAGSKAKSAFLATMSHEIRTPMNGVLGMTEILLSSGLDKRQHHLASSAYRSAEGLLSVINDILDFSKIEADKLDIEARDFDLLEVCEDALEIIAENAHRKGLELVVDLSQETPLLVGDPTRIRQVLLNLLSNATKFTEAGEIRLKQHCEFAAGQAQVLFEISDSGIGIEADKLDTLFDAFVQADGTISRQYGGTGLGLTISKRIVELMGGELTVSSEWGLGTTFRFQIPLPVSTNQEPTLADHESLRGLRALIVDDHSTNREILQGQLANFGMRSESAKDGPEALQWLEQAAADGDPYRVALFDWHMPQMDGIQLATKVNADPRIPELPIVVLSSAYEAAGSGVPDGIVSRFLTKPVRRADLLASLQASTANSPDLSSSSQQIRAVKGRVLLAEDNEINQEVAMAALEVAGCVAQLANNGLEALEAVQSGEFDLVLMDCHMPKMDGFEATEKIRAFEQETGRPRTPVVALTADVRKGLDAQCLEVGMDGYMSKPFSQEALGALLDKWLCDTGLPGDDEQAGIAVSGSRYCDPAAVQQLIELGRLRGKDILGQAATLYQKQFPQLLAQARTALEQGDLDSCANAIHSLKSSSANLGVVEVSKQCAEIEHAARDGLSQGLAGRLEAVAQAYAAARPELDQMAGTKELSTTAQSKPISPKGPRVLIADDDPAIRLTLRETLLASGYLVDECESGAEALQAAKRQRPDVILLDAIMPGMDGFETCQRLHEDPRLCHVPIMMITGLNDVGSINRAYASGAMSFTTKPINLLVLTEDLRFLLRTSSNAAQLRAAKSRLEAAQRLSRIGYWRWEIDSDKFQCSAQIEEIFGLAAGAIGNSKNRFFNAVREQDRDSVIRSFQQAVTGEVKSIEYSVLSENGQELLVRQEVEVNFDHSGERVAFGAVQDISAQRAAEGKIRKLAYYDSLTSLASRSYFMQRIDEMVKASRRRNEAFTLFFMDLDGFKDVNDSMGHDVGDHLLTEISRRLRVVFRETDFIARLGGDEFCVLMDNLSDHMETIQIAQRCLQAIGEPLELGMRKVRPRASIGIARYPEDGDNPQALIKAADSAMYLAKRNGKHRFEYFSQGMTQEAEKRLTLVAELREAVEQKQFLLWYQPIIETRSGRVKGVEALVRWQHPVRGLVQPNEFISAIERMGLICELGEWVLQQACAQAAVWSRSLGQLDVTVNTSPEQFLAPNFVQLVKQVVADSGISPASLILEVTESAFQGSQEVLDAITDLRRSGIRFAIDDFGTGYSSLGSIHKLPVDFLKIDRLFLREVLARPRDAIMLGSIMSMAHALDLQVVAEGIEEPGQVQIMESLGCDFLQGFCFSKPVAAAEIPVLAQCDFREKMSRGAVSDTASTTAALAHRSRA